MPTLALLVGIVLVAIGLGAFVRTGAHAPTALIPAVLGVLIAISGLLSRNPRMRMHAMHAAVLFALLGALACIPALGQIGALIDGTAARPVAVTARLLTLGVCVAFVVSGVKSFVDARRARTAAGEEA